MHNDLSVLYAAVCVIYFYCALHLTIPPLPSYLDSSMYFSCLPSSSGGGQLEINLTGTATPSSTNHGTIHVSFHMKNTSVHVGNSYNAMVLDAGKALVQSVLLISLSSLTCGCSIQASVGDLHTCMQCNIFRMLMGFIPVAYSHIHAMSFNRAYLYS